MLTDISPVSVLLKLQELEFSGQPVTGIAQLAPLSNLVSLYMIGDGSTLESNGFAGGVSVLSNFNKLQTLYAGYRGVTDISSMINLTNIVTADLDNDPITDISPIANWGFAQDVIFAGDGNIGAVPPLTGLGSSSTALTLDLSYNNGLTAISNLSGVPGFQASGSTLNLHADPSSLASQVSTLQGAIPSLAITYP